VSIVFHSCPGNDLVSYLEPIAISTIACCTNANTTMRSVVNPLLAPNNRKQLPLWKTDHPELDQVFSQVLLEIYKRVNRAFAAFFRRVQQGEHPGYPRSKGQGQYDGLTYPQLGFQIQEQAVIHRPVEGEVKT